MRVTLETQSLIEWECSRLSGAFSYYLDNRNYDALAELFAEDGVWVRLGSTLTGRQAIRQAMDHRPSTQFNRHVLSNLFFTHVDMDRASSVAHMMTYFSHETGADVESGARLRRFDPVNAMPLDVVDDYVRTPDGWRFAKRVIELYMVPDHVRPLLAAAHG